MRKKLLGEINICKFEKMYTCSKREDDNAMFGNMIANALYMLYVHQTQNVSVDVTVFLFLMAKKNKTGSLSFIGADQTLTRNPLRSRPQAGEFHRMYLSMSCSQQVASRRELGSYEGFGNDCSFYLLAVVCKKN